MNLRLLLTIALLASMSGCVTLPESGTELRDYETSIEHIDEAIALPAVQVEAVEGRVCVVDPVAFEQFIVAADANTDALILARRAYFAKAREVEFVLMAGRQAEIQAEIYREVANGYSGAIQAVAWPASIGLGGILLLLVAL